MKIEYRKRPEKNDSISPNPKYLGRKSRAFWAITDSFSVVKIAGYSTQYRDAWLCPALGRTMTEGISLFGSPAEAYRKAIEVLELKLKEDKKKLQQLLLEALPYLA
jgi:hypothetical protein